MSAEKVKNDKYTRILSCCRIGFLFLTLLFIGIGMKYSLFSIVQLGIFQIAVVVFVSLAIQYRKYELRLEKDTAGTNKNDNNQEAHQSDQLTNAVADNKQPAAKKLFFLKGNKSKKKNPKQKLKKFSEFTYPLCMLFTALILIYKELNIFMDLKDAEYIGKPPVLIGIFVLSMSFVFLVSSNLFRQFEEDGYGYKMLRLFISASQRLSLICGLAVLAGCFEFGQIEHWLSYFICVLLIIIFTEVGFQAGRYFADERDKQSIELNFYILQALLSGGNPVSRLMSDMENNTGISFRSTWTIRFIRRNILTITLIAGILFWMMTSFVQINPEQQGVLFSFGRLDKTQPLLPGIHLKLPWPVQTVKTYPVYKVKSFTVGYETSKRGDYLWTANHNGEEYKLLLGGGKELVSINMQVYFKIGNLYDYILQYDAPEERLKAEAYRILLNETVVTDLDKLLSLNRSSFSEMVKQKLQETSKKQRIGIDVTNVALISIHPPIEIAEQYQEIVSADIQKQTIVTNAEAYAGSAIPKAEKAKEEMVKTSRVESLMRKSQATGDVLKYSYAQKAYHINKSAYLEWKWLETLERILPDKKIYLLDKNLNLQKGSLWFDMRKTEATASSCNPADEHKADLQEGEKTNGEEAY
ncbi:regulator of protease activity HflC (stomatin/prohibitin superfamily) [Ruminiclostridium sufflavum DSM 19573]|uniref:Regulator of protease activity HflC (Stomatin/prohibitin superfamily) n=1 Tax=Ruminiclostridium sufflavum DSM 19573 TaxID=1121337 RepID=A0A318XPB6_9FIRM|nr:protease modulator HflK [Ruminiclostridium sufflavum]PYG90176.1 regulator of protease activity HflC (stomatin/prohibitin superfamily) [Ruminiclostridium sufflavum DSM 19573]